MKKMLTMKQGEKRAKETERRKKIDKLCCRSALLLSVVSCISLIHVELRIQEHHQLISHSVTSCDHMKAKILQKLQPQGPKDSQEGSRKLIGKAIQKVIGKRHEVLNGVSFYFCYIV